MQQSKPNWRWSDRGDDLRKNRQRPRRRQPAKPAMPVHETEHPKMDVAGRLLVGVTLACVVVLSQQVWLSDAETLMQEAERIPFYRLLSALPYIGGVVKYFGPYVPELFGVGIWFWINMAQSGKDVIRLFNIRHPWWVSQITHWSQPKYVCAAYVFETIRSYDRWPIYKASLFELAEMLKNMETPDPSKIIWINIPLLLFSVLSFEFVVRFFAPKTAKGARNGRDRKTV